MATNPGKTGDVCQIFPGFSSLGLRFLLFGSPGSGVAIENHRGSNWEPSGGNWAYQVILRAFLERHLRKISFVRFALSIQPPASCLKPSALSLPR